jgi:hypothetical protein
MMKKAKILITIILGLGFGYFFMFKSNYERLDNPANIPNNLEESFTELDRILPAATRLTISDHSLWITATSFSVGDTLVQLNENEIKIAIYDGKLKFDGEIGDDNSGLYRLQKDATGAWQLSLLHQKIGEVVTFEN